MFNVMPQVFQQMPAGAIWGTMFFLSIFVVAMLSLMAAYEVLVAACEDVLGWSRRRALVVILIAEMLLALPAMFIGSYIEYSDLIWGTTMQPVGSVIAIVAIAFFCGKARMLDELRRNSRLPIPSWLFYWIKYGIPITAVTILVYGWANS